MPEKHAVLGPSGATRWLGCPASVRMSAELGNLSTTNKFAEEGTAAHELGEIEARLALGIITPAEATRERNAWRKRWQAHPLVQLSEEMEEEMANHIAGYVAYILMRRDAFPNTTVMLEQRLPTGVPSSWGTSDVVLVSPLHVEIVDLKYGMGYRVEAVDNPQVKLYGVGALEAFGDLIGEVEQVIMTIYQPRLEHVDSTTLTPEALRAWRDSIIPIAEEALGDNARFGPSDETCSWCPASGLCKAQMEWATQRDFGAPADTLTNEELADAVAMVPAIMSWCEAVKKVALDKAYSRGEKLPGLKVVRSNGRRYITDPEEAISALTMVGHALEAVSKRTIKGIGDLEKLLGKEEFNRVLEPFIEYREGSPSLVSADDKRPDINPNTEAMKEFSA